jgi:hypothetical protein
VDGDGRAFVERDRSALPSFEMVALSKSTAEDAYVHLVRAAEEDRPLDEPGEAVVAHGPVRLEPDPLGPDHRLDLAAALGSPCRP